MRRISMVRVQGGGGERAIPFLEFHRLPGNTPESDTNLAVDEIIMSIDLPAKGFVEHYVYLKLRDRTSYAFAIVSVAVGLELSGEQITDARLVLGVVAHKPWRVPDAEKLLIGKSATKKNFARAAEAILAGAKRIPIQHLQSGYCTPGQICSAVGLIREGKVKTADDIRKLMSGNICRCGAYTNIVQAIKQAIAAMGEQKQNE